LQKGASHETAHSQEELHKAAAEHVNYEIEMVIYAGEELDDLGILGFEIEKG
jgi:hypothetical protein